jgi:chromosome segregation ATPase
LQKEISRKQEQIRELDQEILSLRRKEPRAQAEATKTQNQFNELDRALRKIEQSLDDSSRLVRAAQRLAEDVEQYEALLAEHDHARLTAGKMEDDLEKTRASIAKYRESSSATITRLSNWFDIVLREMVPGDVRGSAKLDGNGLKLDVELGGYRSTVAIDSLKVVTFDLAVLAMSMERSLYFPGILIHDSPREADLSEEIYKRLFAFANKLEKCGPAPLFQYILTTTTAPPELFRTEPWLRLEVKGAPAKERLLKVDL